MNLVIESRPFRMGRKWLELPAGEVELREADRYALTLSISKLPMMNHAATTRNRWAQKADVDYWRAVVTLMVPKEFRPPQPLMLSRAIFTRHSSMQPDKAQLGVSFKAIEDALTRSRLSQGKKPRWIQRADVLFDDAPKYLDPDFRWARAPRGAGFITVEIDELVEGACPKS